MKRTKKILSLCMAIVMTLSALLCTGGVGAASLTEQKNQLESQLDALKKEQAAINSDLKDAQNKINNQRKVIDLIYDEMDSYQKSLETLSALIIEYTTLAEQKEGEIERLNEQMNHNYELFKERLVFAQESGSMSYIDFLLGSKDLSDIISRAEVIDDMLEYDRQIIESLVRDRNAITAAKKEIDNALDSCRERQSEYSATLTILEQKRAEAAAYLAQYQNDKDLLDAAYERAEQSKKEVEDRLDKVLQDIANQSAGSSTFDGTFIWPLPLTSPGYITQYWKGARHSGIDIGVGGWAYNGIIPAISVAAGKVVRIGSYSDWGNLVVVDHGGGYVSYYAHLDSFKVSYGQYVTQGQQVGMIGSTGRSTGPHLHLCLYAPVNGSSIRVNPLDYIPRP